MKIEKLGKNHRKEVIGGLIVISVIGVLAFNLTKAKYQRVEDIRIVEGSINYKPYDFKMMAMYKSDNGTSYTEITGRMPSSGYVINEEKSYCTINNVDKDDKAKLYTDKYGQHVIENISKNDKCYLYFDKNTEIVNTVLGSIEVNNYTPDFSLTATTDEGIFKAEDNDGVSYYWRGAATTNYLKFGGYCWRIIRINGDGTIRLIYDGTTCHNNGESTTDSIAEFSVMYNTKYDKSEYVGWTYVEGKQRPEVGDTPIETNAKLRLEEWYNKNLASYSAKIEEGKYCNDREVDRRYTWSQSPNTTFWYAPLTRRENASPTLSCLEKDIFKLNIGFITSDEVIYAGGRNKNNESFYLYNGNLYWTISPYQWNAKINQAHVFCVRDTGFLEGASLINNRVVGFRPVINLKSDITISGGNGTKDNPYVVLN